MRLSVLYPAIIVVCLLGLVGLLLGFFQVSVSFESAKPQMSPPPPTQKPQPRQVSSSVSPEKTAPSTTPIPTTAPTNLAAKNSGVATHLGSLRISNQTTQPVRLALLSRQSSRTKGSAEIAPSGVPAHWDFAPKEGSERGLILSLPNGNLKLDQGDILVAFAQDGSRRYWGPYVVGETSLPSWNSQKREWQLVLSP